MYRIHTYIYICITAVLITLGTTACSNVERTIRRAEAARTLGEHAEAANLYRRAYQRTPSTQKEQRGKLAYCMGEAYRRYGNTARALGAYQSAERYKYTDTLTWLRLGDMLRQKGDYKGAAQKYEAYLAQHPADEAALVGLSACHTAPELRKAESAYTIKQEKLFSSSRSDYCPAYPGSEADQIFFTTTRQQATGSELSGITAQKNGDIYFAKKDEKGRWKKPEPAEGGINTEFDEGACAFTADGQTMYFTVCRTDPQYPRMAEIWTATRQDASWAKPQQLTVTADTLSSYAHPAVSADGQWLYFTSDMPGGYGGMDLWRADISGGHGIGSVENLGTDINTAGNEVFPTLRPNGELYFSSDQRVPNLGGLDLYRAVEDTVTHRWKVHHLPVPMNSNADDFGMTFEGIRNRGYFSSGRATGGRGWDKIYAFSYPEVLQSVKGWVYEQDGYELPEATVFMVGDDGTYVKTGVLPDGSFEAALTPGVDYLFLATCPGYLNYRNALHADSLEQEHQYVLQFPLASISIPVLVRNVFYEFDKADLTDNSREALDRLSNMLKENPNITIELSAHCDHRGDSIYNQRLSQRRAESVVRYLTENGIAADRLTPVGYGESRPKVVNRRQTEVDTFLHEGDTLTEAYIMRLTPEQQEICNALNRRTEFRVLRTTYGLFDEDGKLRPDALKPRESEEETEEE